MSHTTEIIDPESNDHFCFIHDGDPQGGIVEIQVARGGNMSHFGNLLIPYDVLEEFVLGQIGGQVISKIEQLDRAELKLWLLGGRL